jgi:hypothetical protein
MKLILLCTLLICPPVVNLARLNFVCFSICFESVCDISIDFEISAFLIFHYPCQKSYRRRYRFEILDLLLAVLGYYY